MRAMTDQIFRKIMLPATVMLVAGCGEFAIDPAGQASAGSAAFSRNGSLAPRTVKDNACTDRQGGKARCDGGNGGSSITWMVRTFGMDGRDYVNVCYPRNITRATAPQTCLPGDSDYHGQITVDGEWSFTFTPSTLEARYFVATPYHNGDAGSPFTGGAVGARNGSLVVPGACAVGGPFNLGPCTPGENGVGDMSYYF
jgi:hypothetical protein